jgi:hypothetical protein
MSHICIVAVTTALDLSINLFLPQPLPTLAIKTESVIVQTNKSIQVSAKVH